ncbi:MAG: class I SAM-dependent methyltransferase [Bacteroidales bacterium]|jgi:SAM-dependent methyltransferase|nr:class I SAM-dependent methyltransferase [Bacteroidales bacterium]
MSTFTSLYSEYYNLLYKDKDYGEEFQYVLNAINNHSVDHVTSILDIGCGTGKHLSFFKKNGFTVSGIDLSENMLKEAKRHLCQDEDLLCFKASEFKFNKKFDIIISLFHVMSYQTQNDELEKVFMNISNNLVYGGLFLFDFWYGPAVLSDPPVVRIKRLEDKELKIARIAEPVMHYNENTVDVCYQLFIEQSESNHFEKLTERHKMRYLFLPEIEYFSKKAGLSLISSYKWMSKEPLSNTSWYGFIILEKKQP